ncbi:hypothetical protein [Allofournierella massiliensis]|uniref:Uncharacterized protein n=1 Tax=Allofournierella massiliensis TaxID=1650663 RepID=A0A4R1QLS6_9FIRM|nr:hypothetical protein [Fournierella massiliensis]TCL53863.1 hypothetical protein EDD77_12637 [Fournierella massiliensis]
MYHIKRVLSLRARLITAAVLLAVLVLAALGLMLGSRQVGRDLDTASAQALRQAVLQAAVQCYAVEGSYPASLDYLEENYGLLVNHDRFIVTYEAFASNLMPQVNVLERA